MAKHLTFATALALTLVTTLAARPAAAGGGGEAGGIIIAEFLPLIGASAGASPIMATGDVDRSTIGIGYSAEPHAIATEVTMNGYFNDGHVGTEGRSSSSTWISEGEYYLSSDVLGGMLLRPTPDGSPATLELAIGFTSGFELDFTNDDDNSGFSSGFYTGPRFRAGCRSGDVLCLELMGHLRSDWSTAYEGPRFAVDYGASLEAYLGAEVSLGLTYRGQAEIADNHADIVDHSVFLTLGITPGNERE